MNYVLLYRELIRQRLEDFRLSQGWHKHDMAEECLIQPTDYSGILKNSRVIDSQNKTKNNHKYMLSSGEAALFARRMGTDIYGIVWGTPRDKETIVKLILLGIITNGCKTTPFCYIDDPHGLMEWSLKQKCLPAEYRTRPFSDSLLQDIQSFFSEEYGLFFDKDVQQLFEILRGDYDPDLERLSNYLLEQLMADYSFAESFLQRLTNTIHNRADLSSGQGDIPEKEIFDFLDHKGQYGDLVLDYGEYDYYLFIQAFNKLWDRHHDSYMRIFNEEIFENDALESSLKYFQDDKFTAVVKSDRLIDTVIRNCIENEFVNQEAYLTRMLKTQTFHYLMERSQMIVADQTVATFIYTSDSLKKTMDLAEELGFKDAECANTEEIAASNQKNDDNDDIQKKEKE